MDDGVTETDNMGEKILWEKKMTSGLYEKPGNGTKSN